MNEEQRANYEEAIRKIQEARSRATEEAGEGEETSANTTEFMLSMLSTHAVCVGTGRLRNLEIRRSKW